MKGKITKTGVLIGADEVGFRTEESDPLEVRVYDNQHRVARFYPKTRKLDLDKFTTRRRAIKVSRFLTLAAGREGK